MEKYFGEWVPYSGSSTVILGCILLAIAGTFATTGFRLKRTLRVGSPGKETGAVIIVVWILSILTFLVNFTVYVLQMKERGLTGTAPQNPITKFTFLFALLSFVVVFLANRKEGEKAAFLSAVVAAMAGPMVFELPFDLVVIGRTYPPIPPNPGLFRELFFFPLFLVELTTMSLLWFSPLFKITKRTLYSLAGLFLVFAVWGFLSFSFAYTALFLVLNVVAKAMAFVVVVTLFLPEKHPPVRQDDQARAAAAAPGHGPARP